MNLLEDGDISIVDFERAKTLGYVCLARELVFRGPGYIYFLFESRAGRFSSSLPSKP